MIQRIDSVHNYSSIDENSDDTESKCNITVTMIDDMMGLSKQGEKDCIYLKKYGNNYDKEKFRKIIILLQNIKH